MDINSIVQQYNKKFGITILAVFENTAKDFTKTSISMIYADNIKNYMKGSFKKPICFTQGSCDITLIDVYSLKENLLTDVSYFERLAGNGIYFADSEKSLNFKELFDFMVTVFEDERQVADYYLKEPLDLSCTLEIYKSLYRLIYANNVMFLEKFPKSILSGLNDAFGKKTFLDNSSFIDFVNVFVRHCLQCDSSEHNLSYDVPDDIRSIIFNMRKQLISKASDTKYRIYDDNDFKILDNVIYTLIEKSYYLKQLRRLEVENGTKN